MTKKRTDIVNLKLWLGLFCIVSFFIFAQSASAQIVINEVMYDPKDGDASTGGEWIEVKNEGTTTVDLTTWLFFENETNHGITANGSQFILPGGYAVISKDVTAFKNYYVNLSAPLFKASFSLTDDEKIAMKIGKDAIVSDENSVTYSAEQGAKNDGNSLQKINDNWEPAPPTPGTANSFEESNIATTDTQSSPTVTSSASDSSSYFDATMFARIVVQSGSFISGAPIFFTGEAVDAKKKQIDSAYYLWAFGDGETGSGRTASHIFRYPGSYIVTLTVSSSQRATSVTTTTKVTISPALLRAAIYEEGGAAVTISNDGPKDIDLSSWAIDVGSRRFTIPEHTILSAFGTIILAPETTGFRSPISFVNIYYPNGKPYEQAKKDNHTQVQDSVQALTKIAPVIARNEAIQHSVSASVIQKNSVSSGQTASVIDAVISPETSLSNSSPSQKDDGLWLWYTSAALLGAVALLGLRFTRDSEVKNTFTADDFKISEVTDEIPDDEYDTDEPH